MIHAVSFARNTRTGEWRATCSCGWFLIGEREKVTVRAAAHDLEWEPVEQQGVAAAAPEMLAELRRLLEKHGYEKTAEVIRKAEGRP